MLTARSRTGTLRSHPFDARDEDGVGEEGEMDTAESQKRTRWRILFRVMSLWGAVSFLAAAPAAATNGHLLHAVGAKDSAMGGSTIAEPQDTLGPLFNNVASLTQLPGTRVDVGLEAIRSTRHVKSTLGGVTGRTKSDSDYGLIPAFGVAYVPEESDTVYFLGALGISGFGSDYPQDDSNPILRPQVQNGQNTGGFGHIFSLYQLLRLTGGIATKLTPELSVGFGPTVNYASLSLEPFPGTTPDCTPQGVCAYPDADDPVGALGAGFLAGIHYRVSDTVALAVGYTSPQWFTRFHWNSSVRNPELENFGSGRDFKFRLDAPQSIALGVGVKPSDDLLVTVSGNGSTTRTRGASKTKDSTRRGR